MEHAKQAISSFISADGKHKTTVDEDVRSAVTDEHIHPHRHENLTTAIDKEIHQEHHHTVVQPIKHKETRPEHHTHNLLPVVHKVFHHDNEQALHDTLERDIAKYRNTSVTHETTHSTTTAPVVTGEHIHHHVHEHVQPIIQKEIVVPEVIHTTVPIHETHHAEAVHHGTSTLPVKTLDEFKSDGGVLQGRGVTKLSDTEGCPQPYNKDLQTEQLGADRDMHPSTWRTHQGGIEGTTATAMPNGGRSIERATDTTMGKTVGGPVGGMAATHTGRSENLASETSRTENLASGTSRGAEATSGRHARRTSSGSDNKHEYALGSGTGTAAPRTAQNTERVTPRVDSLGVRSDAYHRGQVGGAAGKTGRSPSLVDKLNPFKDADGDGKKGIMD